MWSVGLFGFYAGPEVHVIDPLALGDPLLARLPAEYDPNWFPGHFTRTIPTGYYETLATGRNLIEDRDLATYYEKLALVTRGPLFDRRRLAEIWNFNTGRYGHLVRAEAYRYPAPIQVELGEVSTPKPTGTRWNQPGNIVFRPAGVEVRLRRPSHARMLEVSLDHNDDYELVFVDGSRPITRQAVPAQTTPQGGLVVRGVEVPAAAVDRGYETVLIRPLRGDNAYALGHLRLLE
jgi:arabinofuranosyltransferase